MSTDALIDIHRLNQCIYLMARGDKVAYMATSLPQAKSSFEYVHEKLESYGIKHTAHQRGNYLAIDMPGYGSITFHISWRRQYGYSYDAVIVDEVGIYKDDMEVCE